MRRIFLKKQVLITGMLIFAAALTVSALGSKPQAAPCRCPLIYAPVTCDHNRTYPNQCVADCHHAKNCVPSGIGLAQ